MAVVLSSLRFCGFADWLAHGVCARVWFLHVPGEALAALSRGLVTGLAVLFGSLGSFVTVDSERRWAGLEHAMPLRFDLLGAAQRFIRLARHGLHRTASRHHPQDRGEP